MEAKTGISLWVVALSLLFVVGCKKTGRHVAHPEVEAGAPDETPKEEPPPAEEVKYESGEMSGFSYQYFPSAADAIGYIVETTEPRILGLGEFHQQHGTVNILSALVRFTSSLLPMIARVTSDLIVETWVATGSCGEVEKKVTAEVDEVTERPEATESDTLKLIKKAVSLNIQPHVLEIDCHDYQKLFQGGEEGMDYMALLQLVGQHLEAKDKKALGFRDNGEVKVKPMITFYGGAIHNDAKPAEMWSTVSFGLGLEKAAPGRYVEVDLLVPEFIENSNLVKNEPWFPVFIELASKDKTLLIQLTDHSYLIVFKKGVMSP
ncbi:MAG: hypothetical protein GY854_12350 [Deltaproteobacteria bacterium]|nr:hypothetical protein [Deltaproteobacteria bacterium]